MDSKRKRGAKAFGYIKKRKGYGIVEKEDCLGALGEMRKKIIAEPNHIKNHEEKQYKETTEI